MMHCLLQLFLVAAFLNDAKLILKRSSFHFGKKEKLIAKLKSNPKTFTFDDAETLLGYLTYKRSNKGKTSGSRIMFSSDKYKTKILLHKPHPRKELLEYQIKQLIEQLEQEGLL